MAKKRPQTEEPLEATGPKLAISLPADGIGSLEWWSNEVEQSQKRRKKELNGWRKNLDRTYRSTKDNFEGHGIASRETICVPTDFWNVEQKSAQLFYQTPYVQVTAERSEVEQATPKFQHILNFELGPKGANAKMAARQAINDVLCASGIGPVEIGYEAKQVPVTVETGMMIQDPSGEVDPMTMVPKMIPETIQKMRTIWDRYYFDHFSPAQLLLPVGLTTTEYDKAPWIGREFDADASTMGEVYDIAGSADLAEYPEDQTLAPEKDREFMRSCSRGVTIYYRAWMIDRDAHPDLIRRLVFVSGKKSGQVAVIHEDLKYQVFENDVMVQGMRGYPIDPLTIRVITDTAYPPSDVTIARPLAEELSIGRSQMLKQRARNIPMRGFDAARVDKPIVTKIERGDWLGMIPFNGPVTDDMIRELSSARFPPENFAFNQVITTDLEKVWRMGANQTGVSTDTARTATEQTIVEQAKDVGMAQDRTSCEEWFNRCADKFASILLVFCDNDRIVEIEGEDGKKRLETWNKSQVQGRYAYTLRPDSSQRLNAAEQREMEIRRYNLTANSPYMNQLENAKALAKAFGQDPNKMVVQPPPPQPEKPKVSISIKGDDLNPFAPQYPNVLALLGQSGVPGLQPAGAQQQGGTQTAASGVAPVDKHDADLTGENSGPPMPKASVM